MSNPNEKNYALFADSSNKKIIETLEEQGAKVFQFPPLETEKLSLDANQDFEIENLSAFDWIIFSDVLTVDYFLEILEENAIDLFEMDSVRVCALGEAVADRLRFSQLHADVIPISVETTDIFRSLTDYIGEDELKNSNFLLLKAYSIEFEIKKRLSERGATVVELAIYQTKTLRTDEIGKLKTLLSGGAIDEFIFSSPTDLIALKYYLGRDRILPIFSATTVSATDKIMFQMLKEHNIHARILPPK